MNALAWPIDVLGSDDDAVVAAALEFIETVDDLDAATVSSVDVESLRVQFHLGPSSKDTHTNDPSRRARGRPRSKTPASLPPRRNRTKETIDELRSLAHALETRLASMTAKAQLNDENSQREAWKALAKRQLRQRRRVETEQHKLLVALAEQTATIQKLQAILTENERRAAIYTSLHSSMSITPLWRADPKSLAVLCLLTNALEPMLTHSDAVLADASFPSTEASSVKIEGTPENGTLAVKLLDTRLVPFSVERTADAVWHNLLHRASQPPTDDDFVQAQFRTVVRGFDGHVEAAMALRRVMVDPQRVTMVRCSVFTYKCAPGHAPRSLSSKAVLTLHHFLWTTVSPPLASSGQNVCRIQTRFVTVPTLEGKGDTAAITQLCADVSQYFNADAHDDIDKLLLGRA